MDNPRHLRANVYGSDSKWRVEGEKFAERFFGYSGYGSGDGIRGATRCI
jgi:hypothetical protein